MAGISIDFYYEERRGGKVHSWWRNLTSGSLPPTKKNTPSIARVQKRPLKTIHVADCELNGVEKADVIGSKDLSCAMYASMESLV